MNYEDVKFELEGLKKDNLILDFKFLDFKNLHILKFSIFTLENSELKIEYSLSECYKLENGEIFESFEQLLNKYSLMYKKQFSKILFDKLSEMSQTAENTG